MAQSAVEYEPIPSPSGKQLNVVVIGERLRDIYDLKDKWTPDIDSTNIEIKSCKQVYRLVMGKQEIHILGFTDFTSGRQAEEVLQNAHAVVVVYNNNIEPEERSDYFFESWIPVVRERTHETVPCYLVEIDPPVSGEPDAPEVGKGSEYFNSLPEERRYLVPFRSSGDDLQYTTFWTVLVDAAKQSYKARRGCCGCCLLL